MLNFDESYESIDPTPEYLDDSDYEPTDEEMAVAFEDDGRFPPEEDEESSSSF